MTWEKLVELWPNIAIGLNSNFMTSLLGALAGAWGGAWAIQRIADRAKVREQLLQEIRSVNNALHLLFGMANNSLNFKEQIVINLVQTYRNQRDAVHDIFRRRQFGERIAPPVVVMDLSNMDILRFKLDALQELMLGKITITGRMLPMFGIFEQTVHSLNQLIMQRNSFVTQIPQLSKDQQTAVVFGLPLPDGSIDDKYGQTMDGIYQTTDDCIYFAVRLAENFEIYGKRVRAKYVRRFGKNAPKVDVPSRMIA